MPVMQEALLSWSLNGVSQSPLLCSPGHGAALIRGHLLTEGVVQSPADILKVDLRSTPSPHWSVQTAVLPMEKPQPSLNPSSCPCSNERLDPLCAALDHVPHAAGQHTVLLWDGTTQVTASDISRHHALDTAVGLAMEQGMDFSRCILCTSGRISLEIVRKAVRAGIPVLCTRKAIGSLAVEFASSAGCILCTPGTPPEYYGAVPSSFYDHRNETIPGMARP